MTITLARASLLPALALATKAIERSSTIPILKNLKVSAGDGKISLTGSDLDCEIGAEAEAQGSAAAFTLPAALFHDAIRKLPADTMVAIEPGEKDCTIAAGRSRFKLPVLPASDFPDMVATGFSHNFTMPAERLSAILATVKFAISSEETRYYLNGIFFHMADGELAAVATDGHRLARCLSAAPDGENEMPGIILPRRTVGLLETLLGEAGKQKDEPADVEVSLSDTKIRFQTSSATLTSKLIDGTFPDYQRVIPKGNANLHRVERDQLMAAIDRVITVSAERGSAVRFTFEGDGGLKLATSNPDLGSAEEELAAACLGGTGVEIGFNGRYCLDMLRAAESADVVFELGEASSPAIVRPAGDDPQRPLFVIMPMRI